MKITRPSVLPPVVRPSVVLSAVSSRAFLPRVAYALLAASCELASLPTLYYIQEYGGR